MGSSDEGSEDEETTKEPECLRDSLSGCDQNVKFKNNALVYLAGDISKQQSIQAAAWLFTDNFREIYSEICVCGGEQLGKIWKFHSLIVDRAESKCVWDKRVQLLSDMQAPCS